MALAGNNSINVPKVCARRHDLLDAGDRDVQRRQGGGHANVAFALHQHERSAVGGNKVCAGDSGIGGDELLPQDFAGKTCQLFAGVERKVGLELALEQRCDAFPRIMQRGSDDVRGLLVGHLQDELRQVAFGDFDARRPPVSG